MCHEPRQALQRGAQLRLAAYIRSQAQPQDPASIKGTAGTYWFSLRFNLALRSSARIKT